MGCGSSVETIERPKSITNSLEDGISMISLTESNASFKCSDLVVKLAKPIELAKKPSDQDLVFGKIFTDHMLRIQWTKEKGWSKPEITKLTPLNLHPGAKVLHYAQELYEGMKAYRGVDGKIRMFRPMHNMTRMLVTAKRACLPSFEPRELIQCILRLVDIDRDWIPSSESSSLYVRPAFIGTDPALGISPSNVAEIFVILSPVGSYFSSGPKPVNLMAHSSFVRSWPGGCGFVKMGSNYAPTLWIADLAAKHDCQQVLWLFGPDQEITEVGAMNIFALFKDEQGEQTLVTPSLESGMILPGITRQSVIELVSGWTDNVVKVEERKLTLTEVLTRSQNGSMVEMFGTGTAAVVCPVANIFYDGQMRSLPVSNGEGLSQRIRTELTDIYYGKVKQHPWTIDIDQFEVEQGEELKIEEFKAVLDRKLAVDNV